MMNYSEDIVEYIEKEIETLNTVDINAINESIGLLVETLKKGKKIYIFGNGGSSSTASHFQGDFNKMQSFFLHKKFQFICLNDNIPTLLSIANDIGYDEIFLYQLEGRIKEGDIVIAISGSGNSRNVIKAVDYAKKSKNQVIGITGFDGGLLRRMADISLHVPINNMQIVEDIHLIFNHMIICVLNKRLTLKSQV